MSRRRSRRLRELQSSGLRCYQILREGHVVLARSVREPTGGVALDERDQVYADEIFREIERASRYFHVRPIPKYSGDPEFAEISDTEVIRRVLAFDRGENQKEAGSRKFPVSTLPLPWQRALIQNIEAIKKRWSFAWVD